MTHRERRSKRIAAMSAATIALLAAACNQSTGPDNAATPTIAGSQSISADRSHNRLAPRIGHVFVIVLENENFTTTFGPGSPATFLNDTLVKDGASPSTTERDTSASTTTSR